MLKFMDVGAVGAHRKKASVWEVVSCGGGAPTASAQRDMRNAAPVRPTASHVLHLSVVRNIGTV